MISREIIKKKLTSELVRELAKELDLDDSRIPFLLSNPTVRDKIDLEAEYYLDSMINGAITEGLKDELDRIHSNISHLRSELIEEFRRELTLITRLLFQSSILNLIPNGNDAFYFDSARLKELVGKNETEQVIHVLLKLNKEKSKIFNELVVHSSKLQRLTTDCRHGIISRDDEMKERNKINSDILQIVDTMEA